MKITWLGTASLFVSSGSTDILIDPYLKQLNPALPRINVEKAARAEACLITHPHLDHFADLQTFLQAGLKRVYVVRQGIADAQKAGTQTGRMLPAGPGITLQAGPFSIRAYPSRHCKFDAKEVLHILFSRRSWKRFGDAVFLLKQNRIFKMGKQDILAWELDDGSAKILVFGSCGHDPDTMYPADIDLLVLAFQGRWDLHEKMIPLLEKIRPKAVMLTHFDDAFPPLTHRMDLEPFQRTMQQRFPKIRVLIPEEMRPYEIR